MGAGGIAVGMATNIAPHNPTEVIDACMAYIRNPEITLDEVMEIVPGPDFPTGGIIADVLVSAVLLKPDVDLSLSAPKQKLKQAQKNVIALLSHELPYQVNKAQLLERIGELVRDKTIEGISDIRDESDRTGMRVVIDLKRDAQGDVVLNQLYRHTRLQTSFAVNQLVLNGGKPEQMGIIGVIKAFCSFREEVVTRRTRHLLGKARDRAHILAGLMVALTSIDQG